MSSANISHTTSNRRTKRCNNSNEANRVVAESSLSCSVASDKSTHSNPNLAVEGRAVCSLRVNKSSLPNEYNNLDSTQHRDKDDYNNPNSTQSSDKDDYKKPNSTQSSDKDDYNNPNSTQPSDKDDYNNPNSTQPMDKDDYSNPNSTQSSDKDDYSNPNSTQSSDKDDYSNPNSTQPSDKDVLSSITRDDAKEGDTNHPHCDEIKEEALQNYSVEDWCELGPSVHAFGHSPSGSDLDCKNDIKESPCRDRGRLQQLHNVVFTENTASGTSNIGTSLSCDMGKRSLDTGLCYNGRNISENIVYTKSNNVLNDRSNEQAKITGGSTLTLYRDSAFKSDDRKSMKNSSYDGNNKYLVASEDDKTQMPKDKNIGNSCDIKYYTKESLSEIKYTHSDKMYNHNTPFFQKLNDMSPNLNKNSIKAKVDAPFMAETTQEGIHQMMPAPKSQTTISNSCRVSQKTTPLTFNPSLGFSLVPNNHNVIPAISHTPPSNVFQSPTNFVFPFLSQNLGNVSKEARVDTTKLAQSRLSTLVSIPRHWTNNNLENSRIYQNGMKPPSHGYYQYQYPSVVQNNRNNVMFLAPQTVLLQQYPHTTVFQQPSLNYNNGTTPYPVLTSDKHNAVPVNMSATSTHHGKQIIHPIYPTANEMQIRKVAEVEEKERNIIMSLLNPTTRSCSSQTPKSESSYHGNGYARKDIENLNKSDTKPTILEISDDKRDVTKEETSLGNHINDRNEAQNKRLEIKGTKSSISDYTNNNSLNQTILDSYLALNDEANDVEEQGEGNVSDQNNNIVRPKMTGGIDFVDPTRLKLDQDDDIGDASHLFNGDNSSDEDWLPDYKTRDINDDEEDSDNEEDIDIDDEDEEDMNVGGKKRQYSKWNKRNKKQNIDGIELNCHYCGKVFKGNYHLKRHLLSHTETRPHQCETCGKRFKQKAHLHGHETVHLRQKSNKPKDIITNEEGIKGDQSPHKCPGRPKKVYSEKELSCSVCSKVFKTLYRLKRHVQSHTDLRPYTCKVCGKGFKQTGHRNEHEANHEKNRRKFLCNICGVIFHCRSSFNNHLKTHRGQRSLNNKGTVVDMDKHDSNTAGEGELDSEDVQHTGYDCPYCTDKFATAQGLNRHLDSHVEVRQRLHVQPYSCQVCCRSFTYKHNLAKHMLTHQAPEKFAGFHKSRLEEHVASGKPSYTCNVCSKVFMRKETLAKHSKVHTGTKPYKCTVCKKEFTQNVHLKVHTRKHTGSRPFQCKRCNVGFIDSTALAKHIEYEACRSENMLFHCTICDKRHYYLGSIKQHIKKEHNEKEVDKFISRTQRQRRQRAATGNAENACRICFKSFSEKGNLIRHVKRKHSDLLKLLSNDLKQENSENGLSLSLDKMNNWVPCENASVIGNLYHNSGEFRHEEQGSLSCGEIKIPSGNSDLSFASASIENFNDEIKDTVKVNENYVQVKGKEICIPVEKTEDSLKNNAPITHSPKEEAVMKKDRIDEGGNTSCRLISSHNVSDIQIKNVTEQIDDRCKQPSKFHAESDGGMEKECNNSTDEEEDEGIASSGEKSVNKDSNVVKEKQEERSTEPNANGFLYHVGLIEKSKASSLRCSNHVSCKDNSNSCLTSTCNSESLRNPHNYNTYSHLFSGDQRADSVNSARVGDMGSLGTIENPTDVVRTNLEVFCDLALMTENRAIFPVRRDSKHISSTDDNNFTSKSSYSNNFQTSANYQYNETSNTNSDSSVTESQLKELGLLVCKDANALRNAGRPSEELYAEYKPWLEQLVRPPQSNPTSNKNLLEASCTIESGKTCSKIDCNNNSSCDSKLSYNSSTSDSFRVSDRSKDYLTPSHVPSSTIHSRSGLTHNTDLHKLAQGITKTNPTMKAPNQTPTHIPPFYGMPTAFPISASNYIHSMRLKEQLLQYVRDHAATIGVQSQNNPSDIHERKEASAQTPLHFDTTVAGTSYNTIIGNASKPSTSLLSMGVVPDSSNILHSLLGATRAMTTTFPHSNPQNVADSSSVINGWGDNNNHHHHHHHNDNNNNNNNNSSGYNPNPTTQADMVNTPKHHSNETSVSSGALQIVTKRRLPSISKTKGPFPCQGCGKCFNARHQLKRHEMTHTEIRPYRCAECGKAFRQKVHLSDHMKRHRGQRPFLCMVCGKRFVLKNELKQHVKNYCTKVPLSGLG